MSVFPEVTDEKEKPTAVCAKKAHKGGFDPDIRAGSGQTQVNEPAAPQTASSSTGEPVWDLGTRVIHWLLAVLICLNLFVLEDEPHEIVGYVVRPLGGNLGGVSP